MKKDWHEEVNLETSKIFVYLFQANESLLNLKSLIWDVKKKMKKNFIKESIKKPGALRKSLHVKKGEKISEKKLEKAEHSKNPKTRKRAFLAETLKKLHK